MTPGAKIKTDAIRKEIARLESVAKRLEEKEQRVIHCGSAIIKIHNEFCEVAGNSKLSSKEKLEKMNDLMKRDKEERRFLNIGGGVNKSIADIAHEIIAKVNDNTCKIDILRGRFKPGKDEVKDCLDSILLSKMCMDAEDVIRELNIINARVHRQGQELHNIGRIIDGLPEKR